MATIFEKDGKQYTIEDGRVVQASTTQEETVEVSMNERVVVGKKLGTVVGLVDSIYGKTAAIRLDDGTVTEKLTDDLERAPLDTKVAATSADDFETEYDEYLELPADTADEIEIKAAKARELNVRAKALNTNGYLPLSDQILYDRIITATYVDATDLREAAQWAKAADENYLESLPKYELADTILRGGLTSGGDASWLDNTEIEPVVVDDAVIAQQATQMVSAYDHEQLANDDFMREALRYALDSVKDEDKPKFASYVKEARTEKLAGEPANVRTASYVSDKDLDGNTINLDDLPLEAIFGG